MDVRLQITLLLYKSYNVVLFVGFKTLSYCKNWMVHNLSPIVLSLQNPEFYTHVYNSKVLNRNFHTMMQRRKCLMFKISPTAEFLRPYFFAYNL